MEPFKTLNSKAVPLMGDNIDTDVITPIGRVMEGLKAIIEFAFEPLRFDESGALRPDCPLNDQRYAGAKILLAGDNFGCGSSRETAVWAVAGLGFRCVIAPSFGDIFYSSCFKNGLLPIVLHRTGVTELAEQAEDGGNEITVDLENQNVSNEKGRYPFEVPLLRKEALLSGIDDLGLIQRRMNKIVTFEKEDLRRRPWVYLVSNPLP
ncbi:MAG: 3-isopropylmalate dehydratase small subunit [Deltaproteobacteria bacterium]|nr:3-isopropylmalate dehydratase small subunit [Deltaproteobacteria bacterium]